MSAVSGVGCRRPWGYTSDPNFGQKVSLTPKSDSMNSRNSSSLCNTGSSHTLVNHLWSAILTSRSSVISAELLFICVLSDRPSSSVTAEVVGNGRAGMIAWISNFQRYRRARWSSTYFEVKSLGSVRRIAGTRRRIAACFCTASFGNSASSSIVNTVLTPTSGLSFASI